MEYLNAGDKAPDFSFNAENGDSVSLSDFTGKKVILYFYPKDDTPGCTAEACNLRDNYSELTGRGYEIIGISPDDDNSHSKFRNKYKLPFKLVADPDKSILKKYGAWGVKKMYGKEYEGVLRTTYIINEKGIIEKVIPKVDTKAHSEQILKELEGTSL